MKKLWRWKPTTASSSDEVDPSVALSAFMKGLSLRLGLGANNPGVRVR